MLIFNWVGFGMLMIWVGILALTMKFTIARPHVLIGLLFGSLIVAALDLVLRLVVIKGKSARLPVLHPKTGGHLFFVPAWIIALLAALLGIVLFIRGRG